MGGRRTNNRTAPIPTEIFQATNKILFFCHSKQIVFVRFFFSLPIYGNIAILRVYLRNYDLKKKNSQ